jgi:hypothetical protein
MWRSRGAGDPGILICWGLLINVVDSAMFVVVLPVVAVAGILECSLAQLQW